MTSSLCWKCSSDSPSHSEWRQSYYTDPTWLSCPPSPTASPSVTLLEPCCPPCDLPHPGNAPASGILHLLFPLLGTLSPCYLLSLLSGLCSHVIFSVRPPLTLIPPVQCTCILLKFGGYEKILNILKNSIMNPHLSIINQMPKFYRSYFIYSSSLFSLHCF